MTEILTTIKAWELVGIPIIFILGTLLHFAYSWAGKATWAAPFSPVNESVWEHGKLLLWPTLLYGLWECLGVAKGDFSLLPAKAAAAAMGLIFMYVGYYAYKLVIKNHCLLCNILLFLISVLVTQHFSFYFVQNAWFISPLPQALGWLLLILLGAVFVLFTFRPPAWGIFKDLQGAYGRR